MRGACIWQATSEVRVVFYFFLSTKVFKRLDLGLDLEGYFVQVMCCPGRWSMPTTSSSSVLFVKWLNLGCAVFCGCAEDLGSVVEVKALFTDGAEVGKDLA